jgi:phosphonate metabolism protein PhnN/1,5-bisphosphokinase (PRPP-forming)
MRRAKGALLIVAGPEGRGKELLVGSARRRFAASSVAFPVRVMTRPARENCDYLSVSRRVFQQMQADGSFALSWVSHGYEAAAPVEMLRPLRAGQLVVLVATREAAEAARALCRRVHVVEVMAGPDAAGPLNRGEAGQKWAYTPGVHRLHHSGDIADGLRRFCHLIETLAQATTGGALPAHAAG